MDGVERALERAQQLEQQNLNTYDIYAAITDHIGLKRLLSSLIAEGKAHLEELETFRRQMDVEERFDETKSASIGDLEAYRQTLAAQDRPEIERAVRAIRRGPAERAKKQEEALDELRAKVRRLEDTLHEVRARLDD